MKKLLIALVLASLFVLGLAVVAWADNGPHGGFTATTDACASCHRAHSAQFGSNALLVMNPEALCMRCHDGSGAGTNVHDGVYSQAGSNTYHGDIEGTDGSPLFGGGFVNALMATAWDGSNTFDPAILVSSRPTTSQHNLDTVGTLWGSGAANTANGTLVLECTSCHDPHGNAGWDIATTPDTRVPSYRLLRWQPQGSDGFTAPAGNINWSGGVFPANDATTPVSGWLVPDNFALGQEWYTIGTTNRFAVADYQAGTATSGNASSIYAVRNTAAPGTTTFIPAAVNVAFFCAQCHDRYFANSALRNAGEASAYCGAREAVPAAATNGVTLTVYPPTAAGTHPVDPTNCLPATLTYPATPPNTTYLIWGDNRPTADLTYHYMHSSGDIRQSVDGVRAAGAGTSLSRSCVACHVSHGTAAQMTEFASNATQAVLPGADINNSVLLRMDNRSICLRCHAGAVGFTLTP